MLLAGLTFLLCPETLSGESTSVRYRSCLANGPSMTGAVVRVCRPLLMAAASGFGWIVRGGSSCTRTKPEDLGFVVRTRASTSLPNLGVRIANGNAADPMRWIAHAANCMDWKRAYWSRRGHSLHGRLSSLQWGGSNSPSRQTETFWTRSVPIGLYSGGRS